MSTDTTVSRFAAEVAAGAALFDELKPDWINATDIKTLDLSSLDQCMLGQHFDGYTNGLGVMRRHLKIPQGKMVPATAYGFCVSENLGCDHFEGECQGACDADLWNQLQNEWVRVITARREGDGT